MWAFIYSSLLAKSKAIKWALIGAGAAIAMNTVTIVATEGDFDLDQTKVNSKYIWNKKHQTRRVHGRQN